jgi:hypothetical protein
VAGIDEGGDRAVERLGTLEGPVGAAVGGVDRLRRPRLPRVDVVAVPIHSSDPRKVTDAPSRLVMPGTLEVWLVQAWPWSVEIM